MGILSVCVLVKMRGWSRRSEGRMGIRKKEGRMEFRSEGRVGSRPGIFGSSSLEWRMKKLENGGAKNLDTRPDALI